ncbi:zinc metalloprotease HtpX [Fortiea contorta]|uniref:zinc metalloprotease HtpX n=1 Tax=Fortiea contorta TaxID=1892405 RepID=UPI000346B4BD|nr:zinc metalloprotease HtpX [Fortiea contorta]
MPSHTESSLEAGLVALKQGNYQIAIAQLQPVAHSQNDTASLQARVGLVMAYARIGKLTKAIALCETLVSSHNLQVQDWAKRALEHLLKHQKRSKKSPQNDETGFVAFDNSPSKAAPVPEQLPQTRGASALSTVSVGGSQITPNLTTNYRNLVISHTDTPKHTIEEAPSGLVKGNFFRPLAKPSIYWRQAARARVWQPLQKFKLFPLQLLAAATFIALFWVLRELLKLAMGSVNHVLLRTPYVEPIQLFYSDPTPVLLIGLFLAIAFSPWLLDRLLSQFYGQKSLSKEILTGRSRETMRVLQRCCQQRGWPLPKLRILPIGAPVAFTYGNLPRHARIVVSQGLLDQLADDEIAVIYATQIAHIVHRDFILMSLVLLVTLPIYKIYEQMSEWGDSKQKMWSWLYVVVSSAAYGIWCLLSGTALFLSKLRLYYSDRFASEVTGNPSALTRALLKIALGIAHDVAKQEHTSGELESLNLLSPVGYKQSISLGSIAGHISFESILMWESYNPYRHWLTINNTHPLIGDRIQRLNQIARHWHIDPELHLINEQPCKSRHQSFLLQIAPWLGIPLGFFFAGLIWLSWKIAFTLKFINIQWIYEDWSFVTGCLLIGFSIGIVIRMNSMFPDIKPTTVQTDDRLPNLLANPSAIPIDSITVCLVGKLIGRQGIGNSLAQDLILQSPIGLVKLHHIPWLGQSINPQDLIGRQVMVTGWFRRGATPAIDIQTLQTHNGTILHSSHPVWSTILAVAAQAWGAYIFLTG